MWDGLDRPDERRLVVIGGGPAGLTAARTLQKLDANWKPEVFEANAIVGGISRTESHEGYRFDIGGHRFFTKVPEVTAFWKEILKDEFITRPRLSRIYYNGKFYSYPLKITNALGNLGPVEAALIMFSYGKVKVFPRRQEETFDDWVTNRFGERLFNTFFKTYTEKVWGIPCSEIRADWAAQRIKNLSVTKAVWNALTGANDTVSLIEEFEYPRLGPGQMWEVCADTVEEHGGSVHLKHKVVKVEREDMRVTRVLVRDDQGEERWVEGDAFVNSMDLRTLLRVMDPPPPAYVMEAAEKLKYRDFLIVTLVLDDADPFPDNWIYVHSPEVNVGRIQNFRAWSPEMLPNDHTSSIGMEYFCHAGDNLWETSDEELIKQAGRELEAINLAPASKVLGGKVIRQPKAYPVYDGEYTDALGIVREWLDGFENFQTVGRNGMHRYNNQDHSMLTAMLAAENILGAEHDLWEVNVERSYHEEFVTKKDDDESDGQDGDTPKYSVVIPAHNAEKTIDKAVNAACQAVPAPAEIIVVDDRSTDRTAAIARKLGAQVISHERAKPLGPARARNLGARQTSTDYLLFLDSDVELEPDAPSKLVREVASDDGIAAAFGSYGTRQACPNIAARYANLRHHEFHQTGRREAATFWTGLGVIRASAFAAVQGFSESIHKPAMEDVEIGYRMRDRGYRIRLVPEAQGTHLKNWKLTQLWRDDIISRAIPWSTLLVHNRAPASLNAKGAERVKAVLAIMTLFFAGLTVFSPPAGIAAATAFIAYVLSNTHFFGKLARHGGPLTALGGVFLHMAYHTYSTATFGLALARKWLKLPPLTEKTQTWVARAVAQPSGNRKP
ncbi:glycosyltransferase [Parvularcula maris]|uniref:Glycosyltransferase n=1 Tax=Parvularcula maris TaxID=2965077 RepID=A0A9X2RL02_9PROT|nr:glycosyltransferase [Parvularcula maris]MCQ8186318.1 glycosyltransferase [Parvularcula maris]